jgi:hypothetical protein
MIVPVAAFSRGGRIFPGEKLRWDEIFLPAIGCPIALTFALLSFSKSSTLRRVGFLVIMGVAFLWMVGFIQYGIEHW